MSGYTVTMTRTPDLSEAERRARLGRVYRFLLSLGNKTAARGSLDSNTRTAASTSAPSQGRDAQTHDTLNLGLAQVLEGC